MRRVWLVALFAVALSACVPVAQPVTDAASGVVLTAIPVEMGTTYRTEVSPSLERLFLRFTGSGLEVNAPECVVTALAVECVVGEVANWYEVTVAGVVTNDADKPYGVACRANECASVYLQPSQE